MQTVLKSLKSVELQAKENDWLKNLLCKGFFESIPDLCVCIGINKLLTYRYDNNDIVVIGT